MVSSDLVAELRAEVARWWETLQRQQQIQRKQAEGKHGLVSPILGAMLGDGPIRMITQGQELTVDMDEKTLGEMQFKDLQVIYLNLEYHMTCTVIYIYTPWSHGREHPRRNAV